MSALFVIVFLAALVGVFKPYIKGGKRWHFGVAAFVSFLMVGALAEPTSTVKTEADKSATVNETSETDTNAAQETVSDEPESKWQYTTDKDEMRGAESRYAQLEGENTINLDFPYGEQRGLLVIRQSPQFGFNILVGVESGQIMCNSFSRSYINVKFDDGPIQRFECSDASDGTNNMVFVDGAKGFLGKLKQSDRMIVEAEFYQNGMQQMTFDTKNLEWES